MHVPWIWDKITEDARHLEAILDVIQLYSRNKQQIERQPISTCSLNLQLLVMTKKPYAASLLKVFSLLVRSNLLAVRLALLADKSP